MSSQNTIRSLLLSSVLASACAFSSAYAGPRGESGGRRSDSPGGSGGGDPRVAAFLAAADEGCTWLESQADIKEQAANCRTELADLTASVNDKKRIARVYSDFKPARNSGVLKDAVTNLESRRIHLNIPRWNASSPLERKVTATMEMTLLLGIPDRYTLGKRLTEEIAASVKQTTPLDIGEFFAWFKKTHKTLNEKAGTDVATVKIPGETPDHVSCALFLTYSIFGPNSYSMYLSLGFGKDVLETTLTPEKEYIGGFVDGQPDLQFSKHEIHYRSIGWETVAYDSDGKQIAKFSDRGLKIELTDFGDVFRMTGTSSRLGERPVVCNVKMD